MLTARREAATEGLEHPSKVLRWIGEIQEPISVAFDAPGRTRSQPFEIDDAVYLPR